MSDFLTNLLRRGAGLLPVIPPRAPDLMPEGEAITPSSELLPPDMFTESPVSPAERGRARELPPPKIPASATPPAVHSAPVAVDQAPIPTREKQPHVAVERPNPVQTEARTEPAPALEQPRRPARPSVRSDAAQPEFTRPMPPVTAQPLVEAHQAAPEPLSQSAASESVKRTLRRDPQPAIQPQSPAPREWRSSARLAAAIARPSEPHRSVAEPALPGEVSEPYLRQQPSNSHERPEEARMEQPGVRVTIGRIEILPPAATPPAVKPPQVSPFADYALARRFLDRRWY